MHQKKIVALSCWALLASVSRAQEVPAPGYERALLPYPGALSTATLEDGEIVAFDGLSFDLYEADGTLIQHLTTLTSFVFPSFIVVDPAESFVIAGESTNGDLLRISLNPASPDTAVNLPFNYDATFADPDTLIVSAATCGIGCGNEIYRVDLVNDVATLICQVPGASGPVAMDADGNLYYGTVSDQFPPPANPSQVLRWDAAQLAGTTVLTEADATVIATGLEGAADLAFDPVGGGLYLAANNFGTGVNVVRQVFGHPVAPEILLEGVSFQVIGNLEFTPGDGIAAFVGYQPPTGGTLRYNVTDFSTVFERVALTTRRPATTISGPGTVGPGLFTIGVTDGPPNGRAFVYYGPDTLYSPGQHVLNRRVPLFVDLNLPTLDRAPGSIPLDANGAGSITYTNPGGLEGLWAIQCLLLDAGSKLTGTSSGVFF